jgi:membrane protease YdiL (CAAX protease family)
MAIKQKKLRTMDIKLKNKEPIHTIISFSMVGMGIIIMLYLGIRHISDDPVMSKSAFMQFALGFIGLLGTQLIAQQPIIPQGKQNFKSVDLNTGIRAIIIGLLGMGIQLISKQVFSFTILEQAVYFVFAAITEEVFFRGFILNLFIKLDQTKMKFSPTRLVGVLVQAIGFAAIHQNYYSNLPMLVSVFVGGLMLGFMYLIWEDLTANILGHFIINIIAVQNILVIL